MLITNQIFIQLAEADRYARAENPHYRRLAVILLDNLLELQIGRQAQWEFFGDHTTCQKIRQHSHKQRRQISRYHGELLEFCNKHDVITDEEVLLLDYAHQVRNRFYHAGEHDELEAELAIRFFYLFMRSRFADWKNGLGLFGYGSGSSISFPLDRAAEDATGEGALILDGVNGPMFGTKWDISETAYWEAALDKILQYEPKVDIRELIRTKIEILITRIEWDLDHLEQNEELSYSCILSSRFSVLTPAFREMHYGATKKRTNNIEAVNYYMALLDKEESLLDIADREDRMVETHVLLENYSPRNPIIAKELIEQYKADACQVLSRTEAEGVSTFLRIEQDTRGVRMALEEFMSDIEGYSQR